MSLRYTRYSGWPAVSAVTIIGTNHNRIATKKNSGPNQKRRSRTCTRTPAQPRAAAIPAGISISSAMMPTPLVITPKPAENQPSVHQRQAGPISRWRSNP